MEILFAFALGGLLVLGALAAKRQRRQRRQRRPPREETSAEEIVEDGSPVEERTLEGIRTGDVLLLERDDFIVKAVVRYDDPPEYWSELCLEGTPGERWILVRGDDSTPVVVGRVVEIEGIVGEPSELLEHRGAVYRLDRRGVAFARVEGDAARLSGRCSYYEYSRPGSSRLWLRLGERGLTSFAGEQIPRHLLSVLGASSR